MTPPPIKTTHSPAAKLARPILSILIPFYHDDPSTLIDALSGVKKDVEILVYDDGTGDADISRSVSAAIKSAQCQAVLFTAAENRGRAFGRNFLFEAAKSSWVLFLDADMMPMDKSFLGSYIKAIEAGQADIIFGGFKVREEKGEPACELHRLMSISSDCAPAAERQRLGPKNVASSNLCVRKTVLSKEPFDNEFIGWGWEDSEWAARVSQRYNLLHMDNAALHLGLETTDTLLRRFKTSGENYLRFTQRHPELAKSLPLHRWVERLRKTPGHSLIRPVLKGAVKLELLPPSLRINALKLWRASWYAEAAP